MGRFIKKCVVPHANNSHRPYLLRISGILFMLAFIGGTVFLSEAHKTGLRTSDFLASVLPSVLVDLANGDRQENDLSALSSSPLLEEAARLKAQDMAEHSYFAHYSPEGLSPWHWMTEAGYEFSYAGENLAVDFDDSIAVNDAWMNSPGHRANILNNHFTEVGIAVARGVYKGREALFVVQMFGTPTSSSLSDSGEVVAVRGVPEVVPVTGREDASSVLGASGEQIFLAVKNISVADKGDMVSQTIHPVPSYASTIDTIFSSPKRVLTMLYLFVVVVLISLLIAVFSVKHERRRHHIASIAFVFLVVIGAFYAYQFFSPSEVTVLSVTYHDEF